MRICAYLCCIVLKGTKGENLEICRLWQMAVNRDRHFNGESAMETRGNHSSLSMRQSG